MRLLALTLLAIAAAGVGLSAQTPAASAAEAVARAVQHRYDTVRDFTAKFVHTYEGGVIRRKATERGSVQIKKPGRMRWEYTDPEKKTFVADGSQVYSYIPADRQVIVQPMPQEDQATTAVLFLTGKGNLGRDFTVTYGELPEAPAGSTVIRMVPRQRQNDYDALLLAVNASNQIQVLSATDRQGGRSTFAFADIKENTGLADKIFAFKIPRGVDVVRSGGTPERP